MSAIAAYQRDWEPLSQEHERLIENEIYPTLDKFAEDKPLNYYSYAVVGVFGAGKTQLLYHIHDQCLNRGILPLYFEAEWLFDHVFEMNSPASKDITQIVDEHVREVENAIKEGDEGTVRDILNPGKDADQEEMVEEILQEFKGKEIDKKAIFVDELEGQYGYLQEVVRAEENSPLRDWLERKDALKFVALAPSGVYEMGGADQDRCDRIPIPPVDIGYLRDEYFDGEPGRANAAWWLSRGNPRHLLKNAGKLAGSGLENATPERIIQFLETLDRIGQNPARVDAANISTVDVEKYKHIINLKPQKSDEQKRFVIDIEEADRATFIQNIAEIFDVDRNVAVWLSRYFFTVATALSDDDNICYVSGDETGGLLSLAIDFLLEYQNNNPNIREGVQKLTGAQSEVSESDITLMFNELSEEYTETDQGLPLSMETIREIFPLPIVNPVVGDNNPDDIREEHEGDGNPLWQLERGLVTVYCFISQRDFEKYVRKDEFKEAAMPDGHGVLCLIAEDIAETNGGLAGWLEDTQKLVIEEASPLLADFYISIAGEVESSFPADFESRLEELTDVDNPTLSRKVRIYGDNLERIIEENIPSPITFCDDEPQGISTWGAQQISDPEIVIPACAQAYRDELSGTDRELLGNLGELFDGPLKFIANNKPGYPTAAGDMFPRSANGSYEHREVIKNIRTYFGNEDQLTALARQVPEDTFRKLSDNRDKDRLLTAFWRAKRSEFTVNKFNDYKNWFSNNVMGTLSDAEDLQENVQDIGASAIDFEDYEDLVNAYENSHFATLHNLLNRIRKEGDQLVEYICELYLSTAREEKGNIRDLSSAVDAASNEYNEYTAAKESLKNNRWEYTKAVQFVGTDEEEIKDVINKHSLQGDIEISDLEQKIQSNRQQLERYTSDLRDIEGDLDEIKEAFNEIDGLREKSLEGET